MTIKRSLTVITAIIFILSSIKSVYAADSYFPAQDITTDQINSSIEANPKTANGGSAPPLTSDPGHWFYNIKIDGTLQNGDYVTVVMQDWQGNEQTQDFYSLPMNFNPPGQPYWINYTLHTSSNSGWRQTYWVSITNNYGNTAHYETPSPPSGGGGGGDTTSPEPPEGIGADRGNQWLMVYWTPSPSSDVDGYNIYVDGQLKATYPADATQGYVSGLIPDTTYVVEVTAFDEEGNESDPISLGVSTVHFVKDVDLMEYLTNPPPIPEPPAIDQISIPPAPTIDGTPPSYIAPEINIPSATEFDPTPPEYTPPQGGGAYTYEPPDFDIPEPIPSPDPLPGIPDPAANIMEGAQPVQDRSSPIQRDFPTTIQQPLEKEAAGLKQTPLTHEPPKEQTGFQRETVKGTTGYTPETVKTTTGFTPEGPLTPNETLEPNNPLLPSDPL